VIAIVGAGFSGTMAAIHLRRILPPDDTIVLLERSGRFARGPAYAPTRAPHLLNVRAMNMSALPDAPEHFNTWLAQQLERSPAEAEHGPAGTFATRRLYGRYLRSLLYSEIREYGGKVRLVADDVLQIERTAATYRLICSSGRVVDCDGVVLAIGNLPSQTPPDGVVFRDPWAEGTTAGLRHGAPVLVVGTGLTMVDLVLDMHASGFAGPIIAISRRGLAPQAHAAVPAPWPGPAFSAAERVSLTALLRRVRAEVRRAAADGIDWRAVVDGLRPITAALWRGMPAAERQRFLRHLRPFWDVHRHRMAPGVAARVDVMLGSGALQLLRGRVTRLVANSKEAHVTLQLHGKPHPRKMRVQRLIYATGVRPAGEHTGLVQALLSSGLARLDPQGMGLTVTEGLDVIGEDDAPVHGMWALGPIVRGTFWECVAVPDIRVQARLVAQAVSQYLRETSRSDIRVT